MTDDEPLERCYRHRRVETGLRCISCERPVCIDCARPGPVGQKCPSCARQSRRARALAPWPALLRAGAAAVVLGAGITAWGAPLVRSLPWVGLLLAVVLGLVVGEAVRRAGGGYRDAGIARLAALGACAGFLWLPVQRALDGGLAALEAAPLRLAFDLLAAALAAWAAARQVRGR